MTFEPPPPPPPAPSPPPPPPSGGREQQQWTAPPPAYSPPGSWNAPQAGPHGPRRSSFDPSTVNALDWGILGAGLLAFVFSFVNFYNASVDTSGTCFGYQGGVFGSASAWHGFFGWFAVLLAVVGSAAVAASIFAPQINLPAPARLIGLAAYALAALSILLALFITPGGTIHETLAGCRITAGVGHGVGYWLTLIVIAGGLALSFLRFQQTGGQLPGRLAGLGNGPGRPGSGPNGLGGLGGPAAPGGYGPPGPGYGPPGPEGYGPPGYGPPQQ